MATYTLTDEQKKLVEDNIPLAHFLANKIYHPHVEYEDAVQLALLGFCKAAHLYDREKSKFTTFASLAAQHTIQMEERKYRHEAAKRIYEGRSLDSNAFGYVEGDSSPPFHELIPDPRQDTYRQVEAKIAIKKVLSFRASLNNRDRAIFNYHVLSGFTQQETAAKMGLSQSYISRIARRLIIELNDIIGLEEPA